MSRTIPPAALPVQPAPSSTQNSRSRLRDLAAWGQGTHVLMGLLLMTAFSFLALAIAAHHVPYFPVDLTFTRAIQTMRTPTLDGLAEWVSWPGYPPQSNVLFGLLILVLLASRHLTAALAQLFAAGSSALLWFQIAPLVGRPRPSADLVYVSKELPHGSFPSGHILNLTAGVGFAWFLAYTLMPRGILRTAILWLLPAFLVLLGLSRIYTGNHWLSDVLGGYLLGALWLWLSIALHRWAQLHRFADRAWQRLRGQPSVRQPARP